MIDKPMSQVDEILNFWFGHPGDPIYGKERSHWFTKNIEFDQQLKTRFLSVYQQAIDRALDHWQSSPRSCLALILLFDQFPRNMFRNTPQAFATDTLALAAAQNAVNAGFDKELLPVERWFIYLPFEHSENLEHQHQAIALFELLRDHPDSAKTIAYAVRHFEVIERFGRFPHRNKILGRVSTEEEAEFLNQAGSSF